MLAGEFPFESVQDTLDCRYGWPPQLAVSASVVSFVALLFDPNPDFRLTMDQIRRNDWLNSTYKTPPHRPVLVPASQGDSLEILRDNLDIRTDILLKMEFKYGFSLTSSIHSILSEEINVITATYKMLLIKFPERITLMSSEMTPELLVCADSERQEEVDVLVRETRKKIEMGHLLELFDLKNAARKRSTKEIDVNVSEDEMQGRGADRAASTSSENPPDSIREILNRRERKNRPNSMYGKSNLETPHLLSRALYESALKVSTKEIQIKSNRFRGNRSGSISANNSPPKVSGSLTERADQAHSAGKEEKLSGSLTDRPGQMQDAEKSVKTTKSISALFFSSVFFLSRFPELVYKGSLDWFANAPILEIFLQNN